MDSQHFISLNKVSRFILPNPQFPNRPQAPLSQSPGPVQATPPWPWLTGKSTRGPQYPPCETPPAQINHSEKYFKIVCSRKSKAVIRVYDQRRHITRYRIWYDRTHPYWCPNTVRFKKKLTTVRVLNILILPGNNTTSRVNITLGKNLSKEFFLYITHFFIVLLN